jgi:hypothetical protein
MAFGRIAVDSFARVTRKVGKKTAFQLIVERFGAPPVFWGRYFKRPGFSDDYSPAIENATLHANGIRLLPIARQTGRVDGSTADGETDAVRNVDAFVDAFGVSELEKTPELLMFLDVEGTNTDATDPDLSKEYWAGWSRRLIEHSVHLSGKKFRILPAIYCRRSANPTWNALAQAVRDGSVCEAAWIFRAKSNKACMNPVPEWDPAFITPAVPPPCPMVAWQFALDCVFTKGIDFVQTNPDAKIENFLLSRLIVPP